MGSVLRSRLEFNSLNRITVGCALCAVFALSCGRTAPRDERRAASRNLILVTVDTLRADRVGVCGGPEGLTPAIDAVGRAGTVFLDATAHAPLTLPSHASILTGRYPARHGVHDNAGFVLGADVPTLATVLHDAGYGTAAFVSSFVLRGSTGLARGFDRYDDRFPGAGRSHLTVSSLERRGPEVGRAAAQWLASAAAPFFLWVHFYDPHAPYDPPPAFAAKFPGKPYEGEIAAADFGLSTVMNALTPERRRDTVVIVTGDHGESLGEHGEPEHGILLYDSTLHVPLVMAGPGIAVGTVREQVRHVDVMPTVLALLGVHAPDGLDGSSLAPRVSGSTPTRLRLDSESTPTRLRVDSESTATRTRLSYAESRFGEIHFGWSPLRSVRDGTWKYIQAPAPELYEVSADPGERDNRYAARRQTADALAGTLDRMTAAPVTASADAAERLRALGYVTGGVSLDQGQQGDLDPKKEIGRYVDYVTAFNDAMARLEDGRVRDAEAAFRRLAHAYPRAYEAHQYLGRALAARGAYDAAVRELDVAIDLSPREATLYFDAGRTLADARQFDAALKKIDEGLRLEPASFYGWLARGQVTAAAGQRDAAVRAFKEAIRLNPDLGVAHLELARAAERQGDREAARVEYQRALDSDDTLLDARQGLERVSR